MLTIEGSASLNLVKEQIDESLSIAESNLEQFVEEPENEARLKAAIEQFALIKGVFKLINLPGASLLSEELEQLGHKILAHHDKNNEKELAAISNAIMVLIHYLEYVEVKKQALPVLLIPTINEVRFFLNRSLITESVFFDLGENNPPRPPKPDAATPDIAQLQASGRRLRHMYQVGLLGILRNESISANAKMMSRAVSRIDALCGNTPISKLWWLTQAVLEAIGQEAVELNTARKSLLGMVDRQIKNVVHLGEGALNKEPAKPTVQECVYIASLAGPVGENLKQVTELFKLETGGLTDASLRHEREILRGPGGTVIRSVAEALAEELNHIKDALDLGARGASGDDEGFDGIADSMRKVANTLIMLGLSKAAGLFKEKSDVVRNWSAEDIDPESEEFNTVADALLYVENSIATLSPRRGPDSNLYSSKAEEAIHDGISVTQLDDARRVVVGEARAGLSLAKRAITSFMDSNWDGMHLNNVPVTLKSVWGGLVFLQLQRAAAVVNSCEAFIENKLIKDRSETPTPALMETLADAITSVDYYLEGMEDDKPIGEGIMDVAEESMQELGFPVKAA
ncbi:MAG: hypothetical protein CMK83_21185 [Pseudomonadales bacterium]|uniref:hypothetical protein n=1 Tax=unclassified Ketobacter TaxID=2639109 RepID=UPI000C44457E|nr:MULTISPECIES: hypothetical protein [unclassified Ketobacter]MAQ26730.1 hypothetical protein [Pseudomonadales bacterium]MEC8810001.1 hypothetical protein [Pseudomonadota bacterium]TNC88705.1 MAG: hypothetical protein CSH49_10535 [Alcanivorax sp.]HAG94303.1 hypothetical protein [Gammaproteobacteria bacterium]MBI28178.1 hypothetical protein [Pseudomonadales bacterium]|tara:strand:- start:6907 stop:8622 length:1716 start_codon:yes stop_codon:yes gene_type:complete